MLYDFEPIEWIGIPSAVNRGAYYFTIFEALVAQARNGGRLAHANGIADRPRKTGCQAIVVADCRGDMTILEQALSGAHDVLVRGDTDTGALRDVIESVAAGLSAADRVDAPEPSISLGPRAALSVLLIHELSTNAIEHGAFSKAGGRARVLWSVKSSEMGRLLRLSWRQEGGPPAKKPEITGFGSKLIKMGLVGTGNVALNYDDNGFQPA